jgi:hypothetical protein
LSREPWSFELFCSGDTSEFILEEKMTHRLHTHRRKAWWELIVIAITYEER